MRMARIGRVLGSGGWRALLAGSAALAAVGAVGIVGAVSPAVASASPQQALDWTNQAPATHPSGRYFAAMAYDAATSTVVLFGGYNPSANIQGFDDTWTWNGTTWTQQHPAVHPPRRFLASMAYDAATGTVVLFGGLGDGEVLGDTWTWNGTTWTQQHPAASPPSRQGATMVYDAATGTVVLFGGYGPQGPDPGYLDDTWTWNGTTWTQQHPAASPSARRLSTMAYDAATGTAVLFSGTTSSTSLGDTWTWDGTTWTQQYPAASPPAQVGASMAYDAATGTAVLFGTKRGTWTWNGTTWTKQAPATSPEVRNLSTMAYDAATGTVVLFGGLASNGTILGDTWTWG
jgi:hypothetical protein